MVHMDIALPAKHLDILEDTIVSIWDCGTSPIKLKASLLLDLVKSHVKEVVQNATKTS